MPQQYAERMMTSLDGHDTKSCAEEFSRLFEKCVDTTGFSLMMPLIRQAKSDSEEGRIEVIGIA